MFLNKNTQWKICDSVNIHTFYSDCSNSTQRLDLEGQVRIDAKGFTKTFKSQEFCPIHQEVEGVWDMHDQLQVHTWSYSSN